MSAAGPRSATLTRARPRDLRGHRARRCKASGLIFVGIDVIGDYLTEINVTSPTGIQEINRFDGADVAAPDLGRHRAQLRREPPRTPTVACPLLRETKVPLGARAGTAQNSRSFVV